MATIELLAKICDKTPKLSQDKVNRLSIFGLDSLDGAGDSHTVLLDLGHDCTRRHLDVLCWQVKSLPTDSKSEMDSW
jgi:hypothetical protein